jgi:hypothetical protein
MASFEFGYDVGHSSIGWAVFQSNPFQPLGAGSVIFGADDCLAKKRRDYRRQRRHIRSTRQRIERIKLVLIQAGFLSRTDMDRPGSASPWFLAARVLAPAGGITLSARELWDVLRWYAHNRGYDGNRTWARDEVEAKEDTEREQAARQWMKDHGTHTMAETVCAVLDVGAGRRKDGGDKTSSTVRFKGRGVAFPRDVVTAEVRHILEAHENRLPGLDARIIQILMEDARIDGLAETAGIRLFKRYKGGLLFGQLIPRFDNRIISSCPVAYEREYAHALAEGKSEEDAKSWAIRQAKVPAKKCREFLLFRWTMILANIQVAAEQGSRPLSVEERANLHHIMVQEGKLTKKEFLKHLTSVLGTDRHNGTALLMPPDADKALVLRLDKEALRRLSGRAPHTRTVMKAAVRDVLAGRHPMSEGGALFRSEELRTLQLRRTVEEKTNNHLVRHRLLILRRLHRDLVATYAPNHPDALSHITIEVNSDLRTFSGLSAKEKDKELGQRLSDFKKVVDRLRSDLPEGAPITAGLIRKARIAQDMGWKCPYTGQEFGAVDLLHRAVDKDHIIPRSLRPSDSLESLVLTTPEVNKLKGQRTAVQFIKEYGGKQPEGLKRPIYPWANYQSAIEALDTKGIHDQDRARKKRRKALLLQEHYLEKEFVPRDLTQTSQLVRLAAEELKKEFVGLNQPPAIVSLPGSVTAETRKAWKLEGCLAQANPEVKDLLERRKTEPAEVSIKLELRGLTHLHHALDACVLACASHYLPRAGNIWRALVSRRRSEADNLELLSTGLFERDQNRQARLLDLPKNLKEKISATLAEVRVVQHVPANRRGLKAEETIWRVLDPEDTHPSALRLRSWAEQAGVQVPKPESGDVLLVRRLRKPYANNKAPSKLLHEGKEFGWAYDTVSLSKLVGPGAKGRLKKIKGAKQVAENFGIILGPKPAIVPFHDVQRRCKASGNHSVLRKGQLIQVPKGRYAGVWKVFSIKNTTNMGLVIDIGTADKVRLASKGEGQNINVSLKTLLRDDMRLLPRSLSGTDSIRLKEDSP